MSSSNNLIGDDLTVRTPTMGFAARVHEFGGPENIRVEQVPVPIPRTGEVLVRVEAAGVGPWDGWIRSGNSVLDQPLPLILGSDFSGSVLAVGPGVTKFQIGDDVFGVTNAQFTGAYAHYAIAKANMITLKPDNLHWDEAASVPVIAVTAWQALFDKGHLTAGQKVLVHGGAGGVGAYAIQFAKQAGAHVITTTSSKDKAYAERLGADVIIDYNNEAFEETIQSIDLVVDLVGGETQNRSFKVLKPDGLLVSAVSNPDQGMAKSSHVKAFFFLVDVSTAALTKIACLLKDGKIETRVGEIFNLNEVKEAHEILDGIRPRLDGKMIIKMR